jgi:hypothetical protein
MPITRAADFFGNYAILLKALGLSVEKIGNILVRAETHSFLLPARPDKAPP